MSVKEIKLDSIRLDGGTQIREKLSDATIEQYREAIVDGAELPPVEVFDDGDDLWLADGFHRWHAHDKAGLAKIKANIRKGSHRDAILHAVGANAVHGLARSNADKRRAVMTLLNDDEWRGNSATWIAETAGVSVPFAAELKKSLLTVNSGGVKCSDGRTMNTANIGKTTSKTIAKEYVTEDGEVLDEVTEIKTTSKTLKSKEHDPNEDAEDVGMGVRFNTTNKADSGTVAARRASITGDKLTELRELLGRLKELTDVPSMQLSPIAIRQAVKSIMEIVG